MYNGAPTDEGKNNTFSLQDLANKFNPGKRVLPFHGQWNYTHEEDLKKSGISPKNAEAYGIYPIDEHRYCINYNLASLVDEQPYFVIKNLKRSGKAHKYSSPKGAGQRALIPKQAREVYEKIPQFPLFFTEGEKKAIKANIEGFPVISLRGNHGFTHQSKSSQEYQLLPEIVDLLPGRNKAYIIWDSDAEEKWEKSFELATKRFAALLQQHGVELHCVILPNIGEGKTGLDDYYVSGKTTEDVITFIEENSVLVNTNPFYLRRHVDLQDIDIKNIALPDQYENIAAPTVLVEDLFHCGKIYVIGGSSKAKKSWVSLNLAYQLSIGGSFWDAQCLQRKVLYFDTEMDADDLVLRKHVACPHDNLTIIRRADIPRSKKDLIEVERAKYYLQFLKQACTKKKYDVLFIDCIYKLVCENDPKQVTILCDVLDDLKKAGITVFCVHHTKKGSVEKGENPFNMLSGSSILGRSIDGGILLMDSGRFAIDSSGNEEPSMQVHFMLRSFRYRPVEYRYFDAQTGLMIFDQENTEEERNERNAKRASKRFKKDELERNFIDFLPLDPLQAISTDELIKLAQEITDFSNTNIRRRKISEWEKESYIKKITRGGKNFYVLGEKLVQRKLSRRKSGE